MSVKISEEVQQNLSEILTNVMATSELVNCIVVTRTGLKIAPDVTADTFSASSSALIDLGERVVGSLQHGTLQEMVINALGGYVILVAVGSEYMLLGSTSAALKMGYYLPFLQKTAWDMENIIYGDVAPGTNGSSEQVEHAIHEKEESPPSPVITMDTIKAADMKAMDDVLAAFEEFGIDDDFAKEMQSIEVPSVGITKEEMLVVAEQAKTSGAPVPDLGTTIMPAAVAEPAMDVVIELPVVKQGSPVTSSSAKRAEPAPQAEAKITSDCPVPIETGEVAPFPLPLSEWNPFGENVTGDAEQPPSEETQFQDEAIQGTEVPIEPVAAPGPVQSVQPTTIPAFHAMLPPGEPAFGEASEYDFDFSEEKAIQKDVVIPEQDSMKDALKALGWEEEDN